MSRKVEQSFFPLWRGSDPNIWLSRLPTKIKIQHCMQKEFWAWRGGRKKTTRTRVDDCSYSCIHPSKPATSQFHGAARSLDTSRHPGAACHPAPSRPGYTITVRILNRGAEADFFANIGKEAAVSQPLVTSASFPSSAKEQANYRRVHTSIP